MKKITLLIAIVMAMYSFETISAVDVNVYAVNENFDSGTLGTWGFTSSGGGLVFTNPAPVAGASYLNLLIQSPTGTATKTFNAPIVQGYDNKVYFDFNWLIGSPGRTGNNAIMYIRDNTGKKIFGAGCYYSTNAALKLLNINSTLVFSDALLKVGSFTMGDNLNIKVTLDFNLKTIDFTATKISTGVTVTLPSLSFLDANAVNVGDIYFGWVRSGSGNGNYQFDNFQIYTKKVATVSTVTVNYLDQDGAIAKTAIVVPNLEVGSTYAITLADKTNFTSNGFYYTYDATATGSGSVTVASDGSSVINVKFNKTPLVTVTVNYLDQDNIAFKMNRVTAADQIIGTTYTALATDKLTFTDATNYYTFDAASTTIDNVIVTADGLAAINLKFKRAALTTGTYSWTGLTNGNWNELDANFSTDGSNSLGYQNTNAITFPATATTKTVSLTCALNLGSQSINLVGDGYTLQGAGSLTGSKGALNLNLTTGQTATLNFINNLDSVNVNGGTALISNDASGKKYVLADGAKLKLQTGIAFAKPIVGMGTINIEMVSDVNYTSTLTGATTVNYILGAAGKLNSSTWSNAVNTLLPACNVNVSTTTGVASGFGVADGSLTSAKVSLGDNIRLLKSYNQTNITGSTVSVGELSGTATSTLEGGFVASRILNYNIGGLNTDATFAGTIKNYIQIASPTAVNTDILNIYKKGTGIWTLTGTSPLFTVGSFNVDAGRVIMNGSLGSTAVPVTVAATGTLSGTGTFAGATTVNGILEGPLNFGSTLTLAGTTNITGTGFYAGEFDVVNVIRAVTNGGTLNITIAAAEPTAPVSIKVINAATYSGTFTTVNVSPAATSASGWGYNHSTGILTYYPLGTGINAEFSNVNIYPTLTRGDVHVNADNVSSIDVVSLTGQLVKQVKTTATNSIINLNGLSTGAYFVKVRFADGSVKAQRILLQK